MARESTKSKLDEWFVGMIFLQFSLGIIVGFILWLVGILLGSAAWMGSIWWVSFCMLVGTALWSGILLRTNLEHQFFFEISEFAGAVVVNQFRSNVMPTDSAESISALGKQMDSAREVSAGYHGKWPWERVVTVDLRRHIVIGGELKAYTKDNVEINAVWLATLTPLSGQLTNYLRWTESARKAFFEGAFQETIISLAKAKNETDIFNEITSNNPESIKKKFGERFGGEKTANEEEERFGTFTNSPIIKAIERSENYRKAAESVKIAEKTNAAIRMFSEDVDRKVAAAAVLGSQGNNNVRTLQIVADINGLQGNRNLVLGGISDLFADDKQDKKGKGK